MFGDDLLAVFRQESAEHRIDQRGRQPVSSDPLRFIGEVNFDQGLGQGDQNRRTETDFVPDVSWFEPRNPDQAGGIGQIPGPGKTGSPFP